MASARRNSPPQGGSADRSGLATVASDLAILRQEITSCHQLEDTATPDLLHVQRRMPDAEVGSARPFVAVPDGPGTTANSSFQSFTEKSKSAA